MKLNSQTLMLASLGAIAAIRSDRSAPLRAENLIRDLYPREETKTTRTPWRTDEEKIQRAKAKRERKATK